MFTVGPEGLTAAVSRVVEGLEAMGIQPGEPEAETFAPIRSTPGRDAPREVADRILASRRGMEGERRQVTVLFAEVTGLTSTGRLDPEELHDLLSPCVELMAEEVHHYEGTVAQFIGHGIMAIFGAPLAHEDDPRRALHAALDIKRRFEDKAEELQAGGIQCDLRMGLNTGLVIVGSIGDDLAMEYTAVGDTVDLASGMEEAAEPGTIYVTEDTYHLAQGYFDFEEAGEVEVRGVEAPLRAYRVLSPRHAATRVEASLAVGLTRFVGRERELEHLAYCLKQAQEGQGQVVGVIGEPGVGKSRLVMEFTRSLPEGKYTLLEGGCYHYGEAIPYLPILEILRDCFEVGEGEDQDTIKKRIGEKMAQYDGHLDDILPPLCEVLSLEVEDRDYLELEPQQRRQRVFDAIRHLLVAESQTKPLVITIEDLHWIDKTSEEFLAYLIDSLPTSSILLVLLYRTEYSPAWSSKTFFSQVRVDQLPGETGADLVRSILAGGDVTQEIPDLIVGRAAGNPLFIEELTHGLQENGSIVKEHDGYVLSGRPTDIEVPDTIQGIIASRLDRLEEDLKGILQVAAVIGREFAYRLLQAITELKKELKPRLSSLQELEFIYEKTLFPELEYIFKHALTQEVAYQSLLIKRRRGIHLRIGQAIEDIYEDRLEEFHEILAYHYSRSDDAGKAIHYLRLSGDKAARSYANREAISFYMEAIRLLDAQPETGENKKKKMDVCLSIIYPLYLSNYPEGSMEILLEAQRLSEELGEDRDLAKVYGILARYHTLKGDLPLGIDYCERCFDAAEKAGDVDTMAATALDINVTLQFAGRVEDVGMISARVIRLIEELHKEEEIRVGGWTVYGNQCGWRGFASVYKGEFEEAKSILNKGLDHTLEVGDTFGTGWIEIWYSDLSVKKGHPGETIEHARKAIECFEETGIGFYSGIVWCFLGFGYYLLGEYGEAVEYAKKGLALNREVGPPIVTPQIESMLAIFQLAEGDFENALRNAEEALSLSRDYQSKFSEAIVLCFLGRIEGEVDPSRVEAALKNIRQSMSMFEEMRARIMVNLGHLFMGEVLEKAGRRQEALESLQKAELMSMETDSVYWLDRTREAMARLGR